MQHEPGTTSSSRARGFLTEIRAIHKWIREHEGPEDFRHLLKMERWGRACTLFGYGTAWVAPNPISALLISHGIMARWFIGHQINHRGYDRIEGLPRRYHSRVFARGWRRYIDWFDWMIPDAWELEHLSMHHARTGERADPDLIERNLGKIRRSPYPVWFRKLIVLLNIATWKWTYYAPQTLMFVQNMRNGERDFRSFWLLFDPRSRRGREFWRLCLGPYFIFRFLLVPSLFLFVSTWAAAAVLLNTILAELLTNIESFVLIGPNHAGSDLYAFEDRACGKAEYYIRQVLTTANYPTGGNARDFSLGFLNYQIEHHIWPDIPLKKYQEVQPRFREACARFGVPYVQEGLWMRLKKTVDVMVGVASMNRTTSDRIHEEFGIHSQVPLATLDPPQTLAADA